MTRGLQSLGRARAPGVLSPPGNPSDALRIAARRCRATVVCTTSPLLLDRADTVALVAGGRVVAEGTHRDLLDTDPRYRAVVTRGEEA